MKTLLAALLAGSLAAPAASPEKPRVPAALVTAMSQRLDARLARLMPDDPVTPVGLTQGAYIPGYGVVFMGTLNLAPTAGISPFHQSVTKAELDRVHQKKMDRLPVLKNAMQEMLADLAASMDPAPAEEQIAVAISLFYFNGENTAGLPSQVVMHGQRKALIAARGNKPLLFSAIQVDEF